jgi:SnoaL-like domain
MSRANSDSRWTVEKMAALGALHAELEGKNDLEPLLATLAPDPVYEFHPIRRRLRGDDRVRRFYTHFFEHFVRLRESYSLLEEWATERSVAQEYEISLRVDGAIERFRVLGILYAREECKSRAASGTRAKAIKLGGERVWASERFIRLLTGPLFDELEPME